MDRIQLVLCDTHRHIDMDAVRPGQEEADQGFSNVCVMVGGTQMRIYVSISTILFAVLRLYPNSSILLLMIQVD